MKQVIVICMALIVAGCNSHTQVEDASETPGQGVSPAIRRAQLRHQQLVRAEALLQGCADGSSTNRLADLKEAERICDNFLWAPEEVFPVLAVVPKARALHLRGKTGEALELLDQSRKGLMALSEALMEQGHPKEETPQFDADQLRAEIESQGEVSSPSHTKDNKDNRQQKHAR